MSEVRGEQAATVDEPEYRGRPLTSWIEQIRDKASGDERNALSMAIGVMSFAALAPDAQAVVMPGRKSLVSRYSADSSLWAEQERKDQFSKGYNAALDEVARLNRHPAPLELLKTLLDGLDDYWITTPEGEKAHAELLAILEGDMTNDS